MRAALPGKRCLSGSVALALGCMLLCAVALVSAARPSPAARSRTDALAYVDAQGLIVFAAAPAFGPQRVARGAYPSLSADGRRIAYCRPRSFTADDPKEAALYIVDVRTGARTTVLQPGVVISHSVFSPRGDRIAFLMRSEIGDDALHSVRTDGSDRRVAWRAGELGARAAFGPVWAPDGKSLLFHDLANLYQVSLTGKLLRRVSLSVIVGRASAVSSLDRFVPNPLNSDLIAGTCATAGTAVWNAAKHAPSSALIVYDRRSGKRARLAPVTVAARSPRWSADGRALYFAGCRDSQARERDPYRVFRIDRDGKNLREIGRGEEVGP